MLGLPGTCVLQLPLLCVRSRCGAFGVSTSTLPWPFHNENVIELRLEP